jgi:hypothetical protein
LNPKKPAFREETADYADIANAADLITEIPEEKIPFPRSLQKTRAGVAFEFRHEQGHRCSDATRQACSQTRPSKTKRRDEITFTEHSASHRA